MTKKRKNARIDPMSCNVPNVNFSLINSGDKRWGQFKKQRLTRGFDESETWSLDYTIASFIAPRLKAFIEIYREVIVDDNNLVPRAERALRAFETIAGGDIKNDDATYKEIDEALHDFADIFMGLWW